MSGVWRFTRRLLVVCLAVAVVVGLGYAWRASPAASLVADGGGRDRPPGVEAPAVAGNTPDGSFDGGERGFDRRGRDSDGVSLSRIDDLIQTLITLAFFVVVVVVIDRRRRRRRPIRPALPTNS